MLRGRADRWRGGPRRSGAGRRDRPVMALPSVALRAAILVGIALVALGVILFRLWFLQILSGQEFLAEANNNRLRSVKIVAPRGVIQDRKGRVIVDNRPGLAVGIRRMDVAEDELPALVKRLAKVLRLPARKVQSRLDDSSGYPYDLVIIEDDVSRRVVSYLLERKMSFPGVEIRKSYLRAYPNGDLAAHILGNLGEITREQLKTRRYKGYAAGDVIGQGARVDVRSLASRPRRSLPDRG